MDSDLLLPLRKACVRHLRAFSPLSAIVSDRVYEEAPSRIQRPFVRYGAPIAASFEATCLQGSDVDITMHAFDEGSDNDRTYRIMDQIRAGLDEAELVIEGGVLMWLQWTGSQLLGSEGVSPQYRHGIVTFTSAVAELES